MSDSDPAISEARRRFARMNRQQHAELVRWLAEESVTCLGQVARELPRISILGYLSSHETGAGPSATVVAGQLDAFLGGILVSRSLCSLVLVWHGIVVNEGRKDDWRYLARGLVCMVGGGELSEDDAFLTQMERLVRLIVSTSHTHGDVSMWKHDDEP